MVGEHVVASDGRRDARSSQHLAEGKNVLRVVGLHRPQHVFIGDKAHRPRLGFPPFAYVCCFVTVVGAMKEMEGTSNIMAIPLLRSNRFWC